MVGIVAVYVRGIIDAPKFVLYEFIAASTIAAFLLSLYGGKIRARWSPARQTTVDEGIYIAFYALAATSALLLGGSLLLFSFQTLLQLMGIPFALFSPVYWFVFSVVLGPVVGGYVGYRLFRKRQQSRR